jgi:hypothetical protein
LIKRAISVLILISATFTLGAAPTPGTAVDSDPRRSEAAVQFREAYGFRVDADYVTQSLGDARLFSNTEFGVPLTEAEAAEVQRRTEVLALIEPAIDAVSKLQEFAGVFIDHTRGGIPTFLFAGSSAGPDVVRAAMSTGISSR